MRVGIDKVFESEGKPGIVSRLQLAHQLGVLFGAHLQDRVESVQIVLVERGDPTDLFAVRVGQIRALDVLWLHGPVHVGDLHQETVVLVVFRDRMGYPGNRHDVREFVIFLLTHLRMGVQL